jgi:uncharacterized protein YbaR (Trm112 family)
MTAQVLDGHYGRQVALDLCHGCSVLWFDGLESLALAPGAILRLFVAIHEQRPTGRSPLPDTLACPGCHRRLVRTSDMQRHTRFSYWRCPADDGRLMTFFDFLREKNFVRPLDAHELAELRTRVQTLTCSSCGAPVDIVAGSACAYCRAPLSLLDAKQVESVVRELKQAEESSHTVPPDLPLRLLRDRQHVDHVFDGIDEKPRWAEVGDSFSLIEDGLSQLLVNRS